MLCASFTVAATPAAASVSVCVYVCHCIPLCHNLVEVALMVVQRKEKQA